MNDTPGSEERKSVPSSSNVTTATLTRAQSLRQQFAESRNSISAGTPPVAVRWHAQHQSTATRRPPSDGGAGDSSSSKSPSPSRKTGEFKRPTSVTWMMGNSTLLTQSGARRPATPTAGISDSVADEQSDYSPAGISGTCRHDPTVTDDSNGQYVHVPTNKGNVLDRRSLQATFKSKSLDLSRILNPGVVRAGKIAVEDGPSSSGGLVSSLVRNAERRRRLFRRNKKANSASGSYEDSPGSASRSSSVESNQSSSHQPTSVGLGTNSNAAGHVVHRGLESALKASTLFAWSSVEHASAVQAHLMPTNQPSFIELLEDQLKSGPEMTRIEHLSDLHYPDADPPCHFCSNQSSLSIHDSNRLKIVSGGRVRGRDGSRESINPPYINLPSPNVQEDVLKELLTRDQDGGQNSLFPGSRSSCGHLHHGARRMGPGPEEEQTEPPASVLTRRRALVPPKIPPYNVDSSEDAEQSVDKETSTSQAESGMETSGVGPGSSSGGGVGSGSTTGCGNSGMRSSSGSIGSTGSGSRGGSSGAQRRSSIVVIPPMQICPGDLLVYSKVLTQRSSVLDWEGSTQSLAGDTDASSAARKQHKNSWSLLKLFDRSGRTKSESLSGLEEVLTCLQPSTFFDDQLSRYRGLCWSDFLSTVQQQRLFGKATKSTLTSTTEETATSTSCATSPVSSSSPPVVPAVPVTATPTTPSVPTTPFLRNVLVRQSTQQDYSSRIKEWTQEKKARFGLVRTMSERCLDRKILPENKAELAPTMTTAPAVTTSAVSQTAGPLSEDVQCSESVQSFVFQQMAPSPGLKSEQRRKEALWDLFQSECAFLYDHIMVLKNVYMDPLKKIQVEGYAMFAEPELLFGNLDELCCVTYSFCKEFITLLVIHAQSGGDTRTTHILNKLFQKSSKAHVLSQAYHRYALNYINALNYLETLRRHMEFCDFEKWCNRDPRCKKLQLTDLLVAPVQHIMKVPLLLREIEARTEDPVEKEMVLKILDKEEASLRELDDKMKWLKNFERLLEIQRSLVWPSVLDLEPKIVVPEFLKNPLAKQPCERLIVSPRRQIVLEGPLSLLDTGRPSDMHVILFDDMLLITRKKKGLGKKKSSLSENWGAPCSTRSCITSDFSSCWRYIVYKQPLSLDRFFLHEINSHEAAAAKLDNGFVIISLNRFQQIIGVHTFQASSEQVKHTWMIKIRETQDRWKRTLQSTVFRAQRTLSSSSPSSVVPCPASATGKAAKECPG